MQIVCLQEHTFGMSLLEHAACLAIMRPFFLQCFVWFGLDIHDALVSLVRRHSTPWLVTRTPNGTALSHVFPFCGSAVIFAMGVEVESFSFQQISISF